jgi:alpha-glucosidase
MLRDNPPAPNGGKRTRPFDFQKHLYNQSHPDIPRFVERLRQVTDEYGERFTLAEVGGDHALDEMRALIEGDRRLNSAYGFDFLYADALTPALVAGVARDWPEQHGWPTWAFENHDAPRAVSRWACADDRASFARTKILLLSALRGSIIVYQGEELGLPQVEVPFERLQDPEAIANWPQTLSRDGARTPMPWTPEAPNFGFSSAADPWLPLGNGHGRLAVATQEEDPGSVLNFTRKVLRFRAAHLALRHGAMELIEAGEQCVVFERKHARERLRCTFNLSPHPSPFTPAGTVLISNGDVGADQLGPYAAAIEEIS